MTINLDIYYDDDNLTGIENDILYYLHKYSFLSLNELQFIFKIDKSALNYELKKLYEKCYVDKNKYHNIIVYHYIEDNVLGYREQKIMKIIEENLIKKDLTYEGTYNLLKDAKLCFDKKIMDAILDCSLNVKKIQRNNKIWLHLTRKSNSRKVIFCPMCSNLIINRSCRACDYVLA